jgi:formamidopyrimidine-DNA glycosylase
MPEFVEAEAFLRTAEPLLDGRVSQLDVVDERMLRRTDRSRLFAVVPGADVVGLRRHGKLLLVDLDIGSTLALTFGLRGRLIVDGEVAGSDGRRRPVTVNPDHVRLRMAVGDHELQLEDQLRLATLEIDVDEGRLGTDVMALDKPGFDRTMSGSSAAIKSRLMDQGAIAGIGNLIADEILYQGGVDPRRRSDDLDDDQRKKLWTGLRRTRERVLERGGSHHGVLIQSGARRVGGICPRCNVDIERVRVGGRTTFYCPGHQR